MGENAPDEAIVQEFKRGNVRAFDTLFRRYQTPVFNYVRRMVGSREAGEDLTQEVFYKALCALGRTAAETHFRAWLYRIATNVSISYLRTQRQPRVSLHEGDEPSQIASTDPASDPERSQLRRETAETIHAVLRRMQENHRQVLLLRDHHGLSYQELGEVMGLSVEAVTSLLYRARHDFQARYKAAVGAAAATLGGRK